MHELDGNFKESYRALEIFFGKPCSFPAHIWSWGIILTHLLESRTSWMRNDWEELWVGTMLDNWRKGWEDSHYDDWGCWRHDFLLLDREMVGDLALRIASTSRTANCRIESCCLSKRVTGRSIFSTKA